jgi:hypothetical protein
MLKKIKPHKPFSAAILRVSHGACIKRRGLVAILLCKIAARPCVQGGGGKKENGFQDAWASSIPKECNQPRSAALE